MVDMDRRLRPVRQRTFLVLATALLLASPWSGWWTVGPLVLAVALSRLAEGQIDVASRPEYWMFGGWAGVEAIIALSVALADEPAMLSLLAIPVVTLSARFSSHGIWAGVSIAAGLTVGVGFVTDASGITESPPLLIAPLAVIFAAALLSTALMRSDIEHRSKSALDPLTGLLNRTSLDTRVREVEEQSRLTREPSGVAVLDLDGFKQINDSCGHAAGDGILKEVAYRLRKELRSYDLIYRLGGDEFLILLPGGDLADAKRIGLRARSIVGSVLADPRVPVTAAIRVSASCGVSASVRGEPFDFKVVSGSADRALYNAKQSGDGFASLESIRLESFGAGA
jgi:diguanylate cyclase (GGDEF)-like protein